MLVISKASLAYGTENNRLDAGEPREQTKWNAERVLSRKVDRYRYRIARQRIRAQRAGDCAAQQTRKRVLGLGVMLLSLQMRPKHLKQLLALWQTLLTAQQLIGSFWRLTLRRDCRLPIALPGRLKPQPAIFTFTFIFTG